MNPRPSELPVAIIGGGMGGLIAAIELAAAGRFVRLFERHDAVGGKLRQQRIDGQSTCAQGTHDQGIDAGPTVFTLADVFEATLARAGTSLADELAYRRADVLARHFWPDGSRLDLFADADRSIEAVHTFAGPRSADQFAGFLRASARAARVLDGPFMRQARPSITGLMRRQSPRGWLDLTRLNPFATLWQALGRHFDDPRLRQLFARYATYTGSDPFQASASLMLIAHVEQAGVWQLEGGMIALAQALARVARRLGVSIETSQTVVDITAGAGRVRQLRLADERVIDCSAIVFNGDVRALAEGALGENARRAVAPRVVRDTGLSGVTWVGRRSAPAADLSHHNVFFSADYRQEFRQIFRERRFPTDPTIYLCAEDRAATGKPASIENERFLCLVNAPPTAPTNNRDSATDEGALAALTASVDARLAAHGLALRLAGEDIIRTDPAAFAAAFPGSRGALYGQAAHGWRAPFKRPTARSRVPGLYLAGGSCHPGAGLPMAALSGQHAAAAVLEDLTPT